MAVSQLSSTTSPRTPTGLPAPLGTFRDRLSSPSGILGVILVAQLMVVLDATIVNVALPHIQASLGLSSANLSWVLNAYILTFGGLLLLGARVGDLVGRRRTFLAGIAIFTASSLAGGFATTGWMLLAARALQGVGAALAAPSSLALLTTTFPAGPARMRAIGLFTTVSAAGGALGLVAGGLLTELVSWRWVMFVNVPIGIGVWLVGRLVLAETPRRLGRFDAAGAVTSTLGMVLVVFGLVEAGTRGWASPLTVGPILVGIALLGAFVVIERGASEPIVPLHLLSHSTRNAANAARGLVYAGMYGVFFFLGQFLQDVQGYSPLRTGIAFLPLPMTVFLSSQLTSRVLVNRFRPKSVMLLGISLSTAGLAIASQLHAATPYAQVIVTLLLVGAGTGISLVSLTSASLEGVAPSDAGAASGLVNVVQQVGAALGVAVLVTIFGAATHHTQLAIGTSGTASTSTTSLLVHGLDVTFAAGTLFALVALLTVALGVQPSHASEPVDATQPEPVSDLDVDLDLDYAALEGAA